VLLRNQVRGTKTIGCGFRFKGLADNKSAIGTKVEVFAGAKPPRSLKLQDRPGYLGQNSTDYVIRTWAQAKEADVVRMLWPSGVIQDEIQVCRLKEHEFLEMDRRGSSCPTPVRLGRQRTTN